MIWATASIVALLAVVLELFGLATGRSEAAVFARRPDRRGRGVVIGAPTG